MKQLLTLLAILVLQSCTEDKPKVFLGFKLLDTEDNFNTHIEQLNKEEKLIGGKYGFKCGQGTPIVFDIFPHFAGKLLAELTLSAGGLFNSQDSVENVSISPNHYSDCILSAYREKYGPEQQIDTLQQMSFKWRDPKDLRVKNNYYDGVAHIWQLRGYVVKLQIAINPISWLEGYENYKFEINYTANENTGKGNIKTSPNDL